uniref:Uncharacterized protein n=1 Tax=Arundo donax TaxID=35708 RepID=A0A0A9K1P9_ARUDO
MIEKGPCKLCTLPFSTLFFISSFDFSLWIYWSDFSIIHMLILAYSD